MGYWADCNTYIDCTYAIPDFINAVFKFVFFF